MCMRDALRLVCFYKQKTAYEVRISDWSSDVCSSDLKGGLYHHVSQLCHHSSPISNYIARMEQTTLAALSAFAFATSITQGPNNMMLMASGANFGLRRPVPHALGIGIGFTLRSEEPTSELPSLMRTSYASFCLKKKNTN